MNWRLSHIWLRGYSDAQLGKNREHCYTEEARATYARGHIYGRLDEPETNEHAQRVLYGGQTFREKVLDGA